MMTKKEFVDQLRNDLSHLYNPERLRQSPLSILFGVAKRFDTALALQRILIDAVNSLEPSADEPHDSLAWQIYEPLYYRYVEQLTPEEVADQMAISVRHLRRKQQTAVEALADLLWEQFNLKSIIVEGNAIGAFDEHESMANTMVKEELAWVKDTASNSSADLSQTLLPVLNLAQKLADSHSVHIDTALDESFPKLAVDPVALRQMILNLLQAAIPRANGHTMRVSARRLDWEVELRIWYPGDLLGHKPLLDDESANLNMAQQLAELAGCKMDLSVNSRSFDVTLVVPALEQVPILVIDDTLDALLMLTRYAYGSRYHVITSHEPEQAIKLAETHQPKAIVLDVMMPHVDGWELFQRLRQHPPTSDIPIIVCTILAQKELAMLLGANDFLRKPISRQTFLNALNQCIG